MSVRILVGDCRERLRELADASIDACVTDPPYALVSISKRFVNSPRSEATEGSAAGPYQRTGRGFMGQKWDNGDVAHDPAFWREVWRVLKPGAHLLAFGGTRTYHRLACAIEDAGFEIRDQIGWAYGSGFPKSHDVAKGIDRSLGERPTPTGEVKRASIQRNGTGENWAKGAFGSHPEETKRVAVTRATSDRAAAWEGWGTALKPAWEPICVARKPLGAPINVRARVEWGLRNQGVEGEIRWTRRASGAGSRSPQMPSGSMAPQPTAVTSAKTASASETRITEPETAQCIEPQDDAGGPTIQSGREPKASDASESFDARSSPLTAQTAGAAARANKPSSPSTISREAEQPIAANSTARSTPPSGDKASPPAIEYFAGIATGLSGSLASVRISRSGDGSFAWPDDLPETFNAGSTVAANVLAHGTGALNIDACRIEGVGAEEGRSRHGGGVPGAASSYELPDSRSNMPAGRWPANIVHDGSDEAVEAFPEAPGQQRGVTGDERAHRTNNAYGDFGRSDGGFEPRGDSGSASRFFYCAKATTEERGEGNNHPTVKPAALMQWLCRLVTPPGGTVLDPFAGSGSTGLAADREGFNAVLVELSPAYAEIAHRRIKDDGGMWADVEVAA